MPIVNLGISFNTRVCFRAAKKRKLFSEPVVYDVSQEKTSGVMSLNDYNKFDVLQQKETELAQMGLTKEEVELKMVDCGLLNKVCAYYLRDAGNDLC